MNGLPGMQFSAAAHNATPLGCQKPDDLSSVLGGVETCGMEVISLRPAHIKVAARRCVSTDPNLLYSPRTLARG